MRERREFAAEVADAIEAGDMRRLRALSIEMAGLLSAVEDKEERKRAKDRRRKTRNPAESVESVERTENRAPPLPSLSSPGPLTNSSFPPGSTSTTQAGGASLEAKSEPPAPQDPSIAGTITDHTAYAIGLASALNRAQTERWGEQPTPVVWSNGNSVALAEELQRAGVPLELARTTIAAVVRKHRGKPFTNLAYFRNPILEAWDRERQKRHDRGAATPGQSPAEREAEAERHRVKLRDEYTRELTAARKRWREEHPEDAEQMARDLAGRFPDTFEGRGDRMAALVREETAAVGFPDFAEWLAGRESQPSSASTGG